MSASNIFKKYKDTIAGKNIPDAIKNIEEFKNLRSDAIKDLKGFRDASDTFTNAYHNIIDKNSGQAKHFYDRINEAKDNIRKTMKDKKGIEDSLNSASKYLNKLKRDRALAIAGTAAVPLAAGAGVGYGLYRYNKKKKQEEEKSAFYYVGEIEKMAANDSDNIINFDKVKEKADKAKRFTEGRDPIKDIIDEMDKTINQMSWKSDARQKRIDNLMQEADARQKRIDNLMQKADQLKNNLDKDIKKINERTKRAKKYGNLALAGAAVPLAAGVGYGLYRYNKKKKREEEKSASYYTDMIEKIAEDTTDDEDSKLKRKKLILNSAKIAAIPVAAAGMYAVYRHGKSNKNKLSGSKSSHKTKEVKPGVLPQAFQDQIHNQAVQNHGQMFQQQMQNQILQDQINNQVQQQIFQNQVLMDQINNQMF